MPAGDVDSLLKKSDSQHESPEDGCPFGPLTQRLLQALVEVSLSAPECIRIICCFRFQPDEEVTLAFSSVGEHYIPHGGFSHT